MKNKRFLFKVIVIMLALCILFSTVSFGCGEKTPEGGTLRIGITVDPVALGWPPELNKGSGMIGSRPALEPLAQYDETGTLKPVLAESWKLDDKAMTLTISLRKGVKFHDGTAFDATM